MKCFGKGGRHTKDFTQIGFENAKKCKDEARMERLIIEVDARGRVSKNKRGKHTVIKMMPM